MRPFVLGTRGSALALFQAQLIEERLARLDPACRITREIIKVHADKHPEQPLATMGEGEGVFVKELQAALIEKRIDLAVHSMKDVPLEREPRLTIVAILKRDEPRDCVVSRAGRFEALPAGARVGTSSLRRRSQLLRWRKDIELADMRGNVDTRLRKLDEGRYDAIVLSACGLIRLGLASRITEYLELERMVPEPGQGAIALEARADDAEVLKLLAGLDHAESRACIEAERAFLGALGGGCRVPIAAYATVSGTEMKLSGIVAAPDGSADLRGTLRGIRNAPEQLGKRLAQQLSDQGAHALLSHAV